MAVTSNGTATVTLPSDTQILIEREFDAPPELVFKAYTTPELIRRWWAGRRGQVTSAEVDLRVGGTWRYVMLAHGEHEVAFHGEFKEIVPNERIVTTEVYEGAPEGAGAALNTVDFRTVGGRTRLSVLVDTPDKAVRDAIIDSGMEVGMQESYDALEEVAVALGAEA